MSETVAFGLATIVFLAMYFGRVYLIRYMKWVASLGDRPTEQFDDPFVRFWIAFVGLGGATIGAFGFVASLTAWLAN